MQIVDNALLLHNIDEKSSQVYDFKIADYASPLLGPNLEVDSTFAMKGAYLSDLIFAEEQENEAESAFKGLRGMTDQATSVFHATAAPNEVSQSAAANGSMAVQPMKTGPENSKEFVELNFQVKYTDDDEKPVQA